MAATLDRKRPYGTVHGGSSRTAYEQDGKEFDAQGREIVRAAPAKTAAVSDDHVSGQANMITKNSQGNLFRDGQALDTEDMTAETLHVLAKDMGLKLHPKTGRAKTLVAITEAAGPADELAAQLGE